MKELDSVDSFPSEKASEETEDDLTTIPKVESPVEIHILENQKVRIQPWVFFHTLFLNV